MILFEIYYTPERILDIYENIHHHLKCPTIFKGGALKYGNVS
jgi:hypothetical protein